MTAREVLDGIRGRLARETNPTAAPTDVARLVAAVEAAIGLHAAGAGHNPECHCGIPAGDGSRCEECGDEYPCPTVAAIEAALKEGE